MLASYRCWLSIDVGTPNHIWLHIDSVVMLESYGCWHQLRQQGVQGCSHVTFPIGLRPMSVVPVFSGNQSVELPWGFLCLAHTNRHHLNASQDRHAPTSRTVC